MYFTGQSKTTVCTQPPFDEKGAPPGMTTRPFRDLYFYVSTASVCEFDVEEDRVRVARYEVWNYEARYRRRQPAVQRRAWNVVERRRFRDRYSELAVVKQHVLAVQREAQVLV